MEDRDFIDAAAKGLKIEAEPFAPLAQKLGLTVAEVIARLERLIAEGKVRRFAASVRHQPLGYAENAMVIARIEPGSLESAGVEASTWPEVSHCYQRPHPDGDPFCLYLMIHGSGAQDLAPVLDRIRTLPGLRGLEVCRSLRELKKTSLSGVSSPPAPPGEKNERLPSEAGE